MRTRLISVLATALITNFGWAESTLELKQIPAPDGAYVIEISDAIRVVNSGSSSSLTLASNLEGVHRVDAKWSPDSRRVVVVISYARGSGVEAAYIDESGWHKALQPDTDLPTDELARQAGATGRLVSQSCRLGDWLDSRRIRVTGELIFSGQKKVPYEYTLVFTSEPGHLDRGGFEEGVIKGVEYHVR
ncbi:MAG: hypothetical protein JOZ31_22435 [Verrucomicrobia bacterium]|nr:hypothetical protein [Verrucomicrobiota bacterium]MBV8484593.1 hypothetical protein [Verrucomicrobiota bacterium]